MEKITANLTPNWFASVMGTGIVATAAAGLPTDNPAVRLFATGVWLAASTWLVILVIKTGVHWVRYPEVARSHLRHPTMGHFYGAPPMALLTVGAGTLLLGEPLLGGWAVTIDWVLWTLGTLGGLVTAVLLPVLTFTRNDVGREDAFAGWLMPVVPPMVSAATGALLVPHTPAGEPRLVLLLSCYAMFGLSLLVSLIMITLLWSRLAHHNIGAAAAVPTLWIVLGPLGQSITATNNLATQAHLAVSPALARAFEAMGVLYGVPVLGFALLWAAIAATITVRTIAHGLPFSLTWWSFTFPVGTCVTGITGLAAHTGSSTLTVMAFVSYGCLVAAWLVVAARTLAAHTR
ncbi:C4-dicarboxylate ABC transporter [Corynebacterium sp. 13CS0277]|uniref:TDT family transporter n=1 Tax=Corynebacterium sp. 13CS0277 TaxID=2071994 RepID=UPI000D0248DD|nr:TDT family transporter [Corynebacterium sp. 13CS0277]PRQ11838.1 C4-dicarboxylate ABC transporter [Corynebacterium sp. 13CS0277]